MENIVLKLNVNKDENLIPEIAKFIANCAKQWGLSKKKSFYLCFVLETALELREKAIRDDNPLINIEVIDSGTYFKINLIDFGEPYILTKNQQAILKRKLVDKYFFQQNGRKGQCFSFVYYYDALDNKQTNITDLEELLDTNFTYSKLRINDEDILEAIKCLYACYGYEYYHQNLYSVQAFKKYVKSNRYIPIVCKNQHNQVLCYCALDENTWFLKLPELSNLTTKPIARGQGLASEMFKQSEIIAQKEQYEGIHVSAVAYHPYTQKMCNKFNYTPTAIEYSINPVGTAGLDRRSDCVIAVKLFNKEKKHDLFIDSKCNEMISSIYDLEGLNYQIHNEVCKYVKEDSDIEYVIDIDTNNCFMKIESCGLDIETQIVNILNKDEVKAMDVITVNLNMLDNNAISGYQALRKEGFIVSGCLPGCQNGDFMILQTFKQQPDYDKIVLLDNYSNLKQQLDKINKK